MQLARTGGPVGGDSPVGVDRAGYIEVQGVSKHFDTKRGRVTALEDVSFTVERGEFVSIVGPSGCGKSTLLRIIAGLRGASGGTVTIDGSIVDGPVEVGMVFQTPALLKWRSALDNVLLAVDLAGRKVRDARPMAEQLLETVGLADFKDRTPDELSGGMKQRVALCRALVNDPDLLVMDEPFGALDAMTRDEMNSELLRIWSARTNRKTILFVTHSIPEAVFLSDRILVMSARPGRIVEFTSSRFPRPRTMELRGDPEFGKQVMSIYQRLHVARSGLEID